MWKIFNPLPGLKMLKPKFAAFCLTFFLLTSTVSAAGLPVKLKAVDTPNDKGESITLTIEGLSHDTSEVEYELLRSAVEDNSFQAVEGWSAKDTVFVDDNVENGVEYLYLLQGTTDDEVLFSAVVGPVVSRGQWFNTERTNVLLGVVICSLFILGFILYARKGKRFYVRPISGLQAVDNAIGRATEMGKPILYSSGLGKMDRVATMASMNILASVAEKTAEYNTPLIFPNYDPVVMATAQEVVFEAYSKAGHPEAFNPDNIFFVTQSQFGYAAAVDGIMTRQLPATNLFFGTFEAEALILAETGNSVGALQIAGTDSTIQLSFFIVACDYTLIGEELFVASGYLTKDPQILGSIKGQDFLKALVVLLILIGGIAGILGWNWFVKLFSIG
ncbi:MAG: DUF6754 domain-containing protein [Candidatus Zixiibacteriota bacterium]